MKNYLTLLLVLLSTVFYAQEQTQEQPQEPKKDYGRVFGGFESNSQWYLNDKNLHIAHPEDSFRSNNYLFLNYNYKRWTVGIQGEAYEPNALLNYNPKYEKTNVSTCFIQYKSDKLDVTAGYFYEQFGSGLVLRSWEDRALGINNALRGGRIIYKPVSYLAFTGLYGQQKSGFDVANADIFGFNSEIGISDMFKIESSDLTLGFSYVGRDEVTGIVNPNFESLTNVFSGRISFSHNAFYLSSEYDFKSEDAVVEVQKIENDFVKPGSAFLLNMGYSKKGFGVDATFRRLENMTFFSERAAKGNLYNDKIMNFIPSLTKQHHNSLANIYVYQAQAGVSFPDEGLLKSGEIGGQVDVFYNFKKESALGGKNGTKVSFNASNWYGLSGLYSFADPRDYKTDFLGFGEKYFSDYNIEIDKKISDKWHTILTYINQYYNKKFIEETSGLVKTNIVSAEVTYAFMEVKSIRLLGEHMWADSDKKNWVAGTLEFNANKKWSFYCSDLYNYGNDHVEKRKHYYNIGSAFRQNSTRVALNYGRQRGGLLCVGGVCRFVPESTGLSLSISTAF
ncbi:DUF6029 family protein [Flavobacterium sp.]|uniref:DUF6029 family protein n=1 Tax=Flavobacterium sp. TaxID=239 RepID=UPI0038FC594D